ncbi:MAG: branched-chain amino acid ABC transporter permease [Betaproteobacteria bacterium]|nr:branched-chain amino acid ABC transporter permease [Betaproteobacteria bacterium]
MDLTIAAILTQDGITTGAVYALLAIALVLVFTVTRVIFIPAGEIVAYAALSMAALQAGKLPGTVALVVALGALTFAVDVAVALAHRTRTGLLASALVHVAWPVGVGLLLRGAGTAQWPQALQIAACLALLVPLGPMLYRLCFQPIAQASTLVLLIVAVAVHSALLGVGLLVFGAEGSRTNALTDWRIAANGLDLSGQSVIVVAVCLAIMGAFAAFFARTLTGKALRAAAINRVGAQLVGVSSVRSGQLAFGMACAVAVLCGVLLGPITTVYYDSGFLIGLKGFVGAIIGGLVSYPIAAAGAVLVGLMESFASFWASAYKEVLVFALIVPVLVWRSLRHVQVDDDEE